MPDVVIWHNSCLVYLGYSTTRREGWEETEKWAATRGNRGETMKTELLNERKIRVQVERAAPRKDIDPEELWFDQDIALEELIELDLLDITPSPPGRLKARTVKSRS